MPSWVPHMSIRASLTRIPPLLTTTFVVVLAASALETTLVRILAGLLAGIVPLIMAIALVRRAPAVLVRCWGACAVILLTIAVFDWPLHLSYLVARPGLERLAQRLRAGETIPVPVRVGLIMVRSTELRHRGISIPASRDAPDATDVQDIACLWTNLDPSGFGGFVQTRPQYLQFNIWSHVRLDDRWQFINED